MGFSSSQRRRTAVVTSDLDLDHASIPTFRAMQHGDEDARGSTGMGELWAACLVPSSSRSKRKSEASPICDSRTPEEPDWIVASMHAAVQIEQLPPPQTGPITEQKRSSATSRKRARRNLEQTTKPCRRQPFHGIRSRPCRGISFQDNPRARGGTPRARCRTASRRQRGLLRRTCVRC